MITQSSLDYDPTKYVKSRSMTGPLPPTYTCFRCGNQGHWIKNCPTNNPDVKRSTGIPRSFMVPVDGPEHKGALLTSSGDYAVPLIDHQAYKEVKKEKPPILPQEEPVAEPEAQIPEELLCRVCKDLLQDAVLIHCCGNSFCDECIRQVLLESDNHECPECQEINVSPDTLIPNRYLRRAVLNFKNQTGYTRVKKIAYLKSPSPTAERVSPQPSPDSTVESQPSHSENILNQASHLDSTSSKSDKPASAENKATLDGSSAVQDQNEEMPIETDKTSQPATPKPNLEEDTEDMQPGTPLADEPPVDAVPRDTLPIQTIGQEKYQLDQYEYHSSSKYNENYQDDYQERYKEESVSSSEPKPISTIATITNVRKARCPGRPAPVRQQFPNQRSHREDRPDAYTRDRDDYHRYDRRHERVPTRSRDHTRYDRSPQPRYHTSEYRAEDHSDSHYDVEYETHTHTEEPSRRHADRYRVSSHPVTLPPAVPVYPVPNIPIAPVIPPAAAQVYPPQPPPPGASPIDTSHIAAQPPPPGVGPLLPPNVSSDPLFSSKLYDSKEPHEDSKKVDDRSIEDKLVAFQRELEEKRDREFSRDRGSRSSRSRSSDQERSRSLSRSRSYSSSKSWSRSPSRSTTRSSRSRSRTPLSSRSRSRSYTPSRSRSWSKPRSYTRSRSHTRTESSRSRSRSRTEPRFRRRVDSRERIRSPRPRSRSRSFTPKNYRHPPHRNISYSNRHSYTPPQYGTSYQYGPPPAVSIPVLRPDYSSHHLHPIHPVPQSVHSRPIEHYPIERQPKCPPSYPEVYPVYDVYQHPRYEREQRPPRYDKRQEYQKEYPRQHPEVIAHRIPGYIGDRSREFKPRYRQAREPRKEIIRELPQVSEQEIRIVHTKEIPEELPPKKKEEKVLKHKKHHHHHKSKDGKKQEGKIPVVADVNKQVEASKNLIKVEVQSDKLAESKSGLVASTKLVKNVEKTKDKKHKHKKHKTGELATKKKKATKKEKAETSQSNDSEAPMKVKVKKKKKLKAIEEVTNENAEIEKAELPVSDVTNKPEIKEDVLEPVEKQPQDENVKPNEVLADTVDMCTDEGAPTILASDAVPETDSIEVETAVEETEENAEHNVNSEEEIEETVEEEESLHVDVPGLSKWEREEFEDDVESRPQRRSAVIVPKEEKEALTSDIIQRAELAILSKPLKPQIALKEKGDSKNSSAASSPEASVPLQHKEPELKSVVNSGRLASPALQVTISTTKEKRSVHSRKEEKASKESSQSQQSKRIKLDRSNYSKAEEFIPNRVVRSSSKTTTDRVRDTRDKASERYERKRSPIRDASSSRRTVSHDRRERDYSARRLEKERELRYTEERLREERRYRFTDDRYLHSAREFSNTRETSRQDRRRPLLESSSQTRSVKYHGRDNPPGIEKSYRGNYQRSRSRSYESIGSHNSYRKKEHSRHRVEQIEEVRHKKSVRERSHGDVSENKSKRKHSPIKPPEKHASELDRAKKPPHKDFHDDLKFEPDYDAYSDVEEKESRERLKRSESSEVVPKKKIRTDKTVTDKGSQRVDSSSTSSSANSESDSSDSDDPKSSKNKISDSDHKQKHKKSKHKKHKKHKHKHKKKKSHKSRRE